MNLCKDKTCGKCQVVLTEENGYRLGNGKFHGYCRACAAEYARKQYEQDPVEYNRNRREARKRFLQRNPTADSSYHRTYRYGITQAQVDLMMKEQNGCCAVCDQPFEGKVCIDHCHKTGKVRGLLCGECNLGLGKFDDSFLRLISAASYLKSHQK